MTDYWKSEHYSKHANYVSKLATKAIEDLRPVSGETILDLGCGDGEIAQFLQEKGYIVKGIERKQRDEFLGFGRLT